MLSFAKSKFLSAAPSAVLTITDKNYVCNQCGDVGPGAVSMELSVGTQFDGYIDFAGYTYTAFRAPALVTAAGNISFRNNASLSALDLRAMVTGGGDFWGCALDSSGIRLDALTTVDHQQLYLAHMPSMTAQPAMPNLTTMNRAVVFSQNYNMGGTGGSDTLTDMHHEYELDYTNVTGISFAIVKNITSVGSFPCGILGGGDLTVAGGTGKSPCAYLYTPLLENLSGATINISDTSTTSGFTTWTYDTSKWLTLGNHFNITLSRNKMTTATMNALLAHLASIANTTPSYYTDTGTGSDYLYNTIDLRFQTNGQSPSDTTSINALTALNISVLT